MNPSARWPWLVLGLAAVACERRPVAEDAPTAAPVSAPTLPVDTTPPPTPLAAPPGAPIGDGGDPEIQAILAAARTGSAYSRLVSLCDDVGHRLSGSDNYEKAVTWAVDALTTDGVRVQTEPVSVPTWIRGKESAEMVAPRAYQLAMLGLGGSPGTPPVEAEVVVVSDIDSLDERVRGRIVLFNTVMQVETPAAKGYGDAVASRTKGPAAAAKLGAVGALVRSMTTRSLGTPHTGVTVFDDEGPTIPAAALSTEDADLIARLAARGIPVRVRLAMDAHTGPDQNTFNVIADLPGSEQPDEVVVFGGHLDSWDVGQGAHDDGAGVVEVIESMHILAAMGRPPRRTIRAVLFANEENGLRGGLGYHEQHGKERHVAAIEADLGGGWPVAWAATGSTEQLNWLEPLARPLGMPVTSPGGGADISPLKYDGVLVIGLRPDDQHYFDVHHTAADTVDKVDPASLREATGALAALVWKLANAPDAPGPTGEAPPED